MADGLRAKAHPAGNGCDWRNYGDKAPRTERHCSAGGTTTAPAPRCRRMRRPLRRRCATAPAATAPPKPPAPTSSGHDRCPGARYSICRRHAGARRVAWVSHGQGRSGARGAVQPRLRDTNYVLQTGLGPADERDPTPSRDVHEPRQQLPLAPGQDELRVPLTWTDGNGITVTKTYAFHRSMFSIELDYRMRERRRRCRGKAMSYVRDHRASIRRSSARCSRSRVLRRVDRRF